MLKECLEKVGLDITGTSLIWSAQWRKRGSRCSEAPLIYSLASSMEAQQHRQAKVRHNTPIRIYTGREKAWGRMERAWGGPLSSPPNTSVSNALCHCGLVWCVREPGVVWACGVDAFWAWVRLRGRGRAGVHHMTHPSLLAGSWRLSGGWWPSLACHPQFVGWCQACLALVLSPV